MRPRELSRSIALFAARTPTLPPATHTNSYALGTREVLLVEPATPYEDEQRAWIAWARALAVDGAASSSRSWRPTTTRTTSGGVDVLTRELDAAALGARRDGRRASTAPRRARARRTARRSSSTGPVPERWQVLHTPGHAPGHVCLWNEDERRARRRRHGRERRDDPHRAGRRRHARVPRAARAPRAARRAARAARARRAHRRADGALSQVHRAPADARSEGRGGARRAAGGRREAPTAEELLPDAYDDVAGDRVAHRAPQPAART